MSNRFRYALLIVLLAAAAGASLLIADQAEPEAPADQSVYAYHVDVAGWYAATPDETVVYARLPLSLEQANDALPMNMDAWMGTNLGTDADIDTWFDGPDLVLRRQYTTATEPSVWLTAIGSRGTKSYHIFEHTPASCYPSAAWTESTNAVYHVPLTQGAMPVNRAVYVKSGVTRLVYYWYQWDGSSRDATDGVTSWRISTDVSQDIETAEQRLEDWMRRLYQQSLAYHRF